MHESAVEDGSNVVIGATAIEQMDHVSEVAREQAQWNIIGHLLLSKRQISLGSVRIVLDECFVGQVAQILHGGNKLFKSGGLNEVPSEMIPQVGFIRREIRPMFEGVGIQQACVQSRQFVTCVFLQVAADHVVQADGTCCQVVA